MARYAGEIFQRMELGLTRKFQAGSACEFQRETILHRHRDSGPLGGLHLTLKSSLFIIGAEKQITIDTGKIAINGFAGDDGFNTIYGRGMTFRR